MRMNRDFRELLECFARHDVRFLVVGGWALAAHGIPRLTKDLDLFPDSPRTWICGSGPKPETPKGPWPLSMSSVSGVSG